VCPPDTLEIFCGCFTGPKIIQKFKKKFPIFKNLIQIRNPRLLVWAGSFWGVGRGGAGRGAFG